MNDAHTNGAENSVKESSALGQAIRTLIAGAGIAVGAAHRERVDALLAHAKASLGDLLLFAELKHRGLEITRIDPRD